MRFAVLGCLVMVMLVALVSVVLPDGRIALGQQAVPQATVASDPGMIALAETVGQKYQQVTVIDTRKKVISVYHIDLTSGVIALRSVRNIHWDLEVSDYNGQRPLPRELQALSEQR